MKKVFNFAVAICILFAMAIFTPVFGFQADPETVSPANVVEWLTPFIVLGATALVRWGAPKIPGWMTMIVVSALSAAVAWATNAYADAAALGFVEQTLYGLLAVFINQVYRQFTGGNSAAKKRKKLIGK